MPVTLPAIPKTLPAKKMGKELNRKTTETMTLRLPVTKRTHS